MEIDMEQEIGDLLRSQGLTLAVAESCTGGLIGHRLTNVPGSSDYFLGGVISYSNEAKVSLLGVQMDTLKDHGAVSRETVLEMARGVCETLGARVGLSVSGIAGPSGGTPDKPIGLVWIGLSAPGGEWAWRYRFDGDRQEVKAAAAQAALERLSEYLQGRTGGGS